MNEDKKAAIYASITFVCFAGWIVLTLLYPLWGLGVVFAIIGVAIWCLLFLQFRYPPGPLAHNSPPPPPPYMEEYFAENTSDQKCYKTDINDQKYLTKDTKDQILLR